MSDTVHYKGKLTPTGKTISGYIGDDYLKSGDYSSAEDYFNDNYYQAAIEYDGHVFEVEKEEVDTDSDSDIFVSSKNKDGSINFEVRYYNGGCGFDKAIDEALKK